MKKTVFITGSSSGFGKSSALLFAEKGWNVIATMRSPENESELTQRENVLVLKLDVQDESSIRKAISDGIQHFGQINVLVNNAGYALRGVFETYSGEQIRRQFEVNVFGLMEVTRLMIPHFRENGGGTIVNLSSMGGRITIPLLSLYHSSKFAIEGFSEALAYELSAINVGVKLIEPGAVITNFYTTSKEEVPNSIPAYDKMINHYLEARPNVTKDLTNPNATAEEVAEAIYQAATDESGQMRYIVGGDAELYVNGRLNNNDNNYMKLMRGYFLE